jgi:hypothetical protein
MELNPDENDIVCIGCKRSAPGSFAQTVPKRKATIFGAGWTLKIKYGDRRGSSPNKGSAVWICPVCDSQGKSMD